MERKFGRRYLNCDTKYIQWELRTVENFFSLIHKAIKFLIIKAKIGFSGCATEQWHIEQCMLNIPSI